jgi:hypothetical protein
MNYRPECLCSFLEAQKGRHNNPALLNLYDPGMECQVNVARGKGEPMEGKRNTYTDGAFEWYNFRIQDVEDARKRLTYPLDEYAKEIGLSGWNWKEKRSKWLGFDFDDLTSHAPGIGISDEELTRIREAVSAIPWVEVRRSTRGGGFHLIVHFAGEGIPTEDHDQHAALARCLLGMMSTMVGFDLAANVDCCGRILWVWSRRATPENQGFAELKPATAALSEADLPSNWRDYLDVVTRRRGKVRIKGVDEKDEEAFESLASALTRVPLDDKHKMLIDELAGSGFSTIWVADHHLLQTHTAALKMLMDNPAKRKELGLVGIFDTLSQGKDPATCNCFMFPMPSGAWKMYRFSPGIAETPTWTQDGKGWTSCDFNRLPSLAVAAKATGGIEDPDRGGFVFDTAQQALGAARVLGLEVSMPDKMASREARLKSHRDGRLVVEVQKRDGDEGMGGWLSKKDHWTQVFDVSTEPEQEKHFDSDALVRALVTPSGQHAGYMLRSNSKTWDQQTVTNVKMRLQALGFRKNEAECVIGAAVGKRWTLVNIPFHPEFLGGRQWNMDAAQFRFRPADLRDDQSPHHPTWDLILKHIGASLDESVKAMEWCQRHEILTGADWLLFLIACILRDPFEPTPYLFLWGPEDSGKSIFHEALSLLVTKGVVSADRALTNPNNFNGELANAILAVVEETDLSQSGTARNRLKEWVTCRRLSIRRMRTDQYDQPSTLHFVQCANRLNFCPVWPGDSRITVCHVPALNKEDRIPKKALLKQLEDEAPQFMATIMGLRLPEPDGRLRIPVVETPDKIDQGNQNAPIALFLQERCLLKRDAKVAKCDLYTACLHWCEENDHETVGTTEFGRQVIEFCGGAVRRKGKVEGNDGKRHDAYQGICLAT